MPEPSRPPGTALARAPEKLECRPMSMDPRVPSARKRSGARFAMPACRGQVLLNTAGTHCANTTRTDLPVLFGNGLADCATTGPEWPAFARRPFRPVAPTPIVFRADQCCGRFRPPAIRSNLNLRPPANERPHMRIRPLCTAAVLAALAAFGAQAASLRWANDGDVGAMDPYTRQETVQLSFLANIHEPLVRRNRDLQVE